MTRMQQNAALMLIISVLAAALMLGRPSTRDGGEKAALTSLAEADVDHIVIAHPGQPAIDLVREDSVWRMTAPLQTEADRFALNNLLALAKAPVEKAVDAPASLAGLGLDPPNFTVMLNGTAIDFGGTEPLNRQRYVRVGEQIALITDPPSAALDANPVDLVSRRLLPEGVALDAIALPDLALAHDPDGRWLVTGQPEAPQAAVDGLVANWTSAESMWNGRADESSTPVAASSDDIVLHAEDGREWRFRIAARDPQLQLDNLDTGLRYHLASDQAQALLALASPPPDAESASPGDPDGGAVSPPVDDAASEEAKPQVDSQVDTDLEGDVEGDDDAGNPGSSTAPSP